jgi:hypothetical protein
MSVGSEDYEKRGKLRRWEKMNKSVEREKILRRGREKEAEEDGRRQKNKEECCTGKL